ncbi:type IV secretion system DNA-binding domain-containing protein [Burkholderia pseudomallei]|uniref:type IV secretion system DNA-binding domain-containing protein n=1 Tax=Burkholderia pseudomallei TaxID=28450 RepID=UPI0024695BD1|nr:type IV secretion system DNA-binding domain-containing protein [Burkholderia pseudomallei]
MNWISEIWNGTWLTGIWDSLPAISQLNLASRFWDGVVDFLASYWHDVKIFTGLGIAVYLLAHMLAPFHRFTLFHPPRGSLFFRGLGMWFMYGCPALFLWEFACLFGRDAREYVFFGLIALALATIYLSRPILRNLRGFAYRWNKKPEILAGTKLIEPRELAKMIEEERVAEGHEPGILKIAEVTIPKFLEPRHTLLRGGPGAGKSQYLRHEISAIRAARQRAIVLDPSDAGFIPEFADLRKDYLINPFDGRAHRFDFRDYLTDDPASAALVASMIVPTDTSGKNAEWSQYAQQFVAYILEAIRHGEIITNQEIIHLCAVATAAELAEKSYWKGTPLYVMFQPGQERFFGSVRGILSTSIEFLRYEAPTGAQKLDIHTWITDEENEDSIIWLSYPIRQRKALQRVLLDVLFDGDHKPAFVA